MAKKLKRKKTTLQTFR